MVFPQIFLDNPAFWSEYVYHGTGKARPVHNALEAVRCLGALEKKSSMILISKNDLKAYLGGNLEGKLVEAYKILEAVASTES